MLLEQGMHLLVSKQFQLASQEPSLAQWQSLVQKQEKAQQVLKIAIIGKYTKSKDAYKSLHEALTHAGMHLSQRLEVMYLDSEIVSLERLEALSPDAILVPGGFGERGSEGKIRAVRFAREQKIPYFGICFGMQMAVLETARNLANMPDAGSTEFGETKLPLVGLMTEWAVGNQTQQRSTGDDLGGTMRLGAYECHLEAGSLANHLYGKQIIHERHRHRFEVNIAFREALESAGMKISGLSPDGNLPEIVERADHPWFVAVQFHPELKSKPFDPHPLFTGFVLASMEQSRLV